MYIKICPKCKSTDVQVDFSNPAVWAYGATNQYVCNECGYMAVVFPEVAGEEIDKLSSSKKKLEKKVDTTSGYYASRLEILNLVGLASLILLFVGVKMIFNFFSIPRLILVIFGMIGFIGSIWFYFKWKK